MTTAEIILYITGIGGWLIGIYNAIVSAKKSTVEEIRELYRIEKEKRLELESKYEELEVKLEARDELISDLKNWIERLLRQLALHAPLIEPEKFIQKQMEDSQILRRGRL